MRNAKVTKRFHITTKINKLPAEIGQNHAGCSLLGVCGHGDMKKAAARIEAAAIRYAPILSDD